MTEKYLPVDPRSYVAADGRLLLELLIDDFTAFWHQHAESFLGRQPYSEATAQLIFMAYLQRVVNGGGTLIFDDRSQAPPLPERTSREETVHRGKRIVIVRL